VYATYCNHNSPGHLSNARWLDDNGAPAYLGDPVNITKKPTLAVDCSGSISDGATVLFSIFRTDSTSDIPRERLQGRNTINSAGSSPAGTAKGKWAYKYLDEDYNKSTKFVFEVSTDKHRKIECPHEFDIGWNTLSESDIRNAENILQSSLTPVSFKRLINNKIKRLTEIVIENIIELDPDTRMFIDSLWFKKNRIKRILNSIAVYDGVTTQNAAPVFSSLGMPNLFARPDIAAISVGQNIYFRQGLLRQPIDQDTAALLTHEAIHSIQAHSFGISTGRNIKKRDKRAHFVTFCLNNEYSNINEYEEAAYKFGGRISQTGFGNIYGYNQVMYRTQYINWWV
jgi:hypothetical protein